MRCEEERVLREMLGEVASGEEREWTWWVFGIILSWVFVKNHNILMGLALLIILRIIIIGFDN